MNTVFMVEDEVLLTDLFEEYVGLNPELKHLGSCGDGSIAMQRCIELKPEVIVLDIRLPGVNGLEMLVELREKLSESKVIVFSGSVDARTVKTVLDGDAHGFVEKSYGLEELMRGVQTVLTGERYYSPGARDYVRRLSRTAS